MTVFENIRDDGAKNKRKVKPEIQELLERKSYSSI